ncbi:helix-turn-helix domain-containing protein [Volucribacter amazonae]|uniref:helix-turn-helix domain-containing protein n=1 Tax=Volucribacter amazonae TaxID=256731 RepID=UPI0024420942|nr:helix-turn-helix domain-containing protein [Volucribacter amazonae]
MSMLLMVKAMNCKVGNSARKLVLLKLADNANDDGVCFPSYQFIADKCEMTRRSAISHINALIGMGLVSKTLRQNKDGSSSNLYQLHLDQVNENSSFSSEDFAPEGVKNLHEGSENYVGGSSENSAPITSHSINQSINHKKINKKSSPKSTALDELEQYFSEFWQAGLPKINRAKALKSFKTAFERSGKSLREFTDLLKADIRKRLALGQFGFDKLHPTTYLNGERWKDEYTQSANQSQSPKNQFRDTDTTWWHGRSIEIRGRK